MYLCVLAWRYMCGIGRNCVCCYYKFQNLNVIFNSRIIAHYRHIRYAKFKIINRPILELSPSVRMFFFHRKIGKQHACRVRSDKYENVPESVQIWKIRSPPGVTIETVRYPAAQGQTENGTTTNAQSIHSHTLFTVY